MLGSSVSAYFTASRLPLPAAASAKVNPSVALMSGLAPASISAFIAGTEPARAASKSGAVAATGGNGVELWGYTNKMGLNVKYLQVSDAQGYGLFTGGVFSGQTCKGVTVEHGIARNTNRNPRYADQNPWDTRCGVVYKKVTPTP